MGKGGLGGARIKVAVRVRPLLYHELNGGHQTTKIRIHGDSQVEVAHQPTNEDSASKSMNMTSGFKRKMYNFD